MASRNQDTGSAGPFDGLGEVDALPNEWPPKDWEICRDFLEPLAKSVEQWRDGESLDDITSGVENLVWLDAILTGVGGDASVANWNLAMRWLDVNGSPHFRKSFEEQVRALSRGRLALAQSLESLSRDEDAGALEVECWAFEAQVVEPFVRFVRDISFHLGGRSHRPLAGAAPPAQRAAAAGRDAQPEAVFRIEGEVCRVRFGGKETALTVTDGVRYLAALLASPNRPIGADKLIADAKQAREASDRLAASSGVDGHTLAEGMTGDTFQEAADEKTIRAVRGWLENDLPEKKEAARAAGDTAALEDLEEKEQKARKYLADAQPRGERPRAIQDRKRTDANRVGNAIRLVCEGKLDACPALRGHLKESRVASSRGGAFCYAPPPPAPEWQT